MSELQVETTGETVGEAKWMALRELEKLRPGLDKGAVRFQVLSEGERGLLGVGYSPARVIAVVDADAAVEAPVPLAPPVDESEAAARLRDLLERITTEIGARCRIEVTEDDESLTAQCAGPDLGLLIGKHGQMIDAVQYLANAIVFRGREDRKRIVVDAAGYRGRRQATVEALATRQAERVLADGAEVRLEPMTAIERKLVHERLKDFEGVATRSEGTEPHRYVVVFRAAAERPVRDSGPGEGATGEPGGSPTGPEDG
jgi:spoIIIJ-associated protein